MKIKLPYGNTAENNGLTLPAGHLTIDLERKAIRMHDGVTQGGYEVLGTQAYTPPNVGPGPETILMGDEDLGWWGEVSSAEFINTAGLSTLAGVSVGSVVITDPQWLKFSHLGKILFVAKQPLRSSVSWDNLNAADVIFGKTVSIGGRSFIVRAMKGALTNPYTTDWGVSGTEAWDLLGNVLTGGLFNLYGTNDLISGANGSYMWFQETPNGAPTSRLSGAPNLSHPDRRNGIYYFANTSNSNDSNRGWRPVLELVVS